MNLEPEDLRGLGEQPEPEDLRGFPEPQVRRGRREFRAFVERRELPEQPEGHRPLRQQELLRENRELRPQFMKMLHRAE